MRIGIQVNRFNPAYKVFGDDYLSVVSQLGFQCVDFALDDTDSPFYGDDGEKYLEKEKMLSDKAGLEICQIHGPWRHPPRDEKEEEREERFEKMVRALGYANILGAKCMVIHPLMPYNKDDRGREEDFHKMNIDFMKRLTLEARKRDVVICLENMPMMNLSYSKPEKILEYINEINDDHFKMCFDTGHVSVFKDLDVADEIKRCKEHIRTLHIHDNKYEKDLHMAPFYGRIDWEGVANALCDISSDVVFSLEVSLPTIKDETILKRYLSLFYDTATNIITQKRIYFE